MLKTKCLRYFVFGLDMLKSSAYRKNRSIDTQLSTTREFISLKFNLINRSLLSKEPSFLNRTSRDWNLSLKRFSILLFILFTFFDSAKAQMVQVNHVQTDEFKSSGTTDFRSQNYTFPAGRNRVVFFTFYVERKHSGANSDNLFLPVRTFLDLKVNGIDAIKARRNGLSTTNTPPTSDTNHSLDNEYQCFVLQEGNIPSGQVTITWNNITVPESSGDELVLLISTFENTHTGYGNVVLDGFAGVVNTNSNNVTVTPIIATLEPSPLNRPLSDSRSLGAFFSSYETLWTPSGSSWSSIKSSIISNPNGGVNGLNSGSNPGNTPLADPTLGSEASGISGRLDLASYTSTGRPVYNLTKPDSRYLLGYLGYMWLIQPLATPEIRGTVFRDSDGSTNINGVGTNLAAGYINVIDKTTNLVVYSTTVASDGTYIIPAGNVYEYRNYDFQLTNIQGTVNSAPPAIQLNPNWSTVGEATGTTGNDGNANSIIYANFGAITANITNYNFGVYICYAGNAAPTVNSVQSIICPTTSINLNSAHTGTVPPNSTLVWFNNSTHSGTALSGAAVTAAGPGTYYAFYYDSVGNCYSPVSNAVVVTQICANDDIYNATATQAVSGTTFPTSVLNNDTYNNSAATTSNVVISIVTPALGAVVPTLNPTTGMVTIPANTPQGVYTIVYRICATSGSPCDTATITVNVPTTTIVADDDDFTSTPISSVSGGASASVFSNDNYNGGAEGSVNSSNATASQVGTWPSGISLNPATGQIIVAAGTTPGPYNLTYQICDKLNPGVCDPAVVKFTVSATVQADDDDFSSNSISTQIGGTTASVLGNDNYNGGLDGSAMVGSSGNVNLSTVGTWPTGFTLNSDGTVTVASGIVTGSYTMDYQICDKINGSPCDTAKITIVVAAGYCYKLPVSASGVTIPTKHGITALGRAGGDNGNWPMARNSAWTVIEAKTKGFVINRVAFDSSGNPTGIATANFVEGMMVYDTTNNCLKIFNGTVWSCYTTPACP